MSEFTNRAMLVGTGDRLTSKGWVAEVLDQVSRFGLAPVCDNCGIAGGSDQETGYPCPVEGCVGRVTWDSAAKAFWWTIERARDQLWHPSLGFEREQAERFAARLSWSALMSPDSSVFARVGR